MATVQISDVIIPAQFSDYVVQNTMEKTALVSSGVAVLNSAMAQQLQAGAESYSVPYWRDLPNDEANVVNDNPAALATPGKVSSGKQIIRKGFLHKSWAAMNLASELSGSDALVRIQDRVTAYWDRQLQRRLIASLIAIKADNITNDAGDMVLDISGAAGVAAKFSATAVIDAAGTLGDGMEGLAAIAMHSDVYRAALKNDLVTTIPSSTGGFIKTFRGLAIVVDDAMPVTTGVYTTILFGPGAVGYATAAPRIAAGTEVENIPGAGNGGGQQILHSRLNLSMHPLGFTWKETAVAGNSPTIAELGNPLNWDRVALERKAVPLAFLVSKI